MKPSRSWRGKPAKPQTEKQRRACKVNWSLFIISGAIGTLESLRNNQEVLSGAANFLDCALKDLRTARKCLRLQNVQDSAS